MLPFETRSRRECRLQSPLVGLTPEGQSAFTEIHTAELANLARIAGELDGADINAAQQVVAHLTGVFAQVARQGLPDEGWSVPDLPNPDLPNPDLPSKDGS